MEKITNGVYKVRLGEPEALTYITCREYPAKPWGKDCRPPFSETDISFSKSARGCKVTLPLNTKVYGFGLQLKAFEHTRGRRVMRNNADAPAASGDSHAPVPFYVTTDGYGIFVDSARDVVFYCGQIREKTASRHNHTEFNGDLLTTKTAYQPCLKKGNDFMLIDIPHAQGVDIYIFAGENMLDAVQKYNMFSGGGASLPFWSLGVWYRMHAKSKADSWVRMAEKFKAEGLPISVLGLEPGWQTHSYSCTFTFDTVRMGNCLAAIKRMNELGYKVNLWEHCYTHPDAPIYEALLPYSGNYEVWGGLVPDFLVKEAREVFTAQQKLLAVDSFKLDECDGSDYTGGWSFPDGAQFPSGLDGEQMHHLLGLLYQQTMNGAFPGSCHSVRASGALASPYPFILYSDLYEHTDFIRGVVNAGFSGLLWAPEVRHAKSIKDLIRRIQTAVFSPQTLINAWYLKNPPWEQISTEENNADVIMPESRLATDWIRELFETRAKLVPYLEKMYELYHLSGKPVFRALILEYPEDEQTHRIDDEYLMGNDYLFAPLTADSDARRVYLPMGTWLREGKLYQGGWHEFVCNLHEYLLFQKQ